MRHVLTETKRTIHQGMTSGRALRIFPRAIIAFLTTATLVFASGAQGAGLVALGDSITYGYGLGDRQNETYAALTGRAFRIGSDNRAVNGFTAKDIIDLLENDANAARAVEHASVVCVAAGGNELLGALFRTVRSVMPEAESLEAMTVPQYVTAAVMVFTSQTNRLALKNACEEGVLSFRENFPKLISRIRELNPRAVIVTQALYNPVLALPDFLAVYVKDFFYFFEEINDVILQTPADITVRPDILFAKNPALFINIAQNDIHPTAAGHRAVYWLISQELIKTEPYSTVYARFAQIIRLKENLRHADAAEVTAG